MPKRPRKRDLTFYLLKPEIGQGTEALDPDVAHLQLDVTAAVGAPAHLFVKESHPSPPWWLSFLREAAADIPDLVNANTAAVLFLNVDGAMFAVPFGYGRNLLKLDCLTRDFGLRVTLNTVKPDTLRSVDAHTFEELTVTKRTQTSRATGLENFSLNEAQEIMKAVTGTPAEATFASRVTGADGAKLTYVPSIVGLADKCRALLAAYKSTAYKESYGFIDHLREVRDRPLTERLNALMIEKLRARDFDAIHLAPPEVSNWADIESFVFDRRLDVFSEDLDPASYVDGFEDAAQLDLAVLKSDRVGVQYGTAAEPHFLWRVYDTIVCELTLDGRLYVITAGTWYSLDQDFADGVLADITALTPPPVELPSAAQGEKEAAYNTRSALAHNYYLFDEKLVKPTKAVTTIEFCDLLTSDRTLVHVKRKSRSSTLSHLFAQGVTSAEVFYRDKGFREALRAKAAAEISQAASDLIPIERPNPIEWTVLFAVITDGQKAWPKSLPFFSQLNLRNSAMRLDQLGFKTGLIRIPLG